MLTLIVVGYLDSISVDGYYSLEFVKVGKRAVLKNIVVWTFGSRLMMIKRPK